MYVIIIIIIIKCQGQVIGFVLFEILDLEKVRIDTEILSVLYTQPEIRKVIIVYIYDLGFEGQPSRSSDLFQFFEIPDLRNVKIDTRSTLHHPVTKGQVLGSLTLKFKIIRQGHVNYFNIFGFYDLNFVENFTNLITLSHLH